MTGQKLFELEIPVGGLMSNLSLEEAKWQAKLS